MIVKCKIGDYRQKYQVGDMFKGKKIGNAYKLVEVTYNHNRTYLVFEKLAGWFYFLD
jgi:hypothetical protein